MAFGSVNVPGKLTATDVGASAANHTHTAAQVSALPITGGTLTGDLRIKGTSNFGTKINLGDGDYVYIAEPTDDNLEIKGKTIKLVTTKNASGIDVDTGLIGKSLAGQSVSPAKDETVTAGEGAEVFNDYRARSYDSTGIPGEGNVASGHYAHAEGYGTTASGNDSHAEGLRTVSSGGKGSHAEGERTVASDVSAHAEGYVTTASGWWCHAEGRCTTASGQMSHAEGNGTTASGWGSHAEGYFTIANSYAAHAGGSYNKTISGNGSIYNTTSDVFVLGNGTDDAARSNCFRVTYSGAVYGTSAFNSTGADYAEFFEWADGNPKAEDRVGLFVTLDGKQIRIANPGDYILGVVSGQPCIIGNADEDWLGRWEHDDFGRFVKEYLEDEETEIDADGLTEDEIEALRRDPEVRERDGKLYRVTAKVVDHKTPSWRYKANPAYDNTQPYIERKDRPEWSAVGMLGVLSVRDDGTCQVNGFCRVAEGGTATAAEAELSIENGQIRKAYRVLERVSENVVRIVFR